MSFKSIIFKSLLPMAFILPLWLTFGRGLFGAGGWTTVIYLFTIAPALFVAMLAMKVFLDKRNSVKLSKTITVPDAILITLLYITVFLHGFFMVDGGDVEGDENSVAAKLFGKDMISFAERIGEDALMAGVFSVSAFFITVASLIYFGFKYFRERKS